MNARDLGGHAMTQPRDPHKMHGPECTYLGDDVWSCREPHPNEPAWVHRNRLDAERQRVTVADAVNTMRDARAVLADLRATVARQRTLLDEARALLIGMEIDGLCCEARSVGKPHGAKTCSVAAWLEDSAMRHGTKYVWGAATPRSDTPEADA